MKEQIEIEEFLTANLQVGVYFKLNAKETFILCYIGVLYNRYKKDLFFINSDFFIKKLPLLDINNKDVMNRILTNIEKKTKLFRRYLTDEEALLYIQTNRKQELKKEFLYGYYCNWCLSENLSLDAHHFPIRKKDKGTITVDICKNCHQLFHDITDNKKIIKILDIEFFKKIDNFSL